MKEKSRSGKLNPEKKGEELFPKAKQKLILSLRKRVALFLKEPFFRKMQSTRSPDCPIVYCFYKGHVKDTDVDNLSLRKRRENSGPIMSFPSAVTERSSEKQR